ncbi:MULTISPECIES: hypothetical protein [unclassified Pseudomonas]|uniref:hypothetical protein n=1 Tax=unclassified Pseudomonas TaxID=196821 RepID=UPI0025F968F8|nr:MULTISPECIES: hypothetical protein [unclassified Pseudomonas]
MKPHHFQTLVIGALCLGVTVLAANTYNHHQQLAELQTAAHSAPANPVPALRRDISALADRLETLQPQVLALSEAQERHTAAQVDLDKQQQALATSLKTLQALPQGPSSTDFATLTQRLTTAETTISQLSARPMAPAATNTQAAATADRIAKPRAPVPPFKLLGLETRGSVRYATVQPPGTHALSMVHLLQLGDSLNGWQLQAIHEDQAVFLVPGYGRRTLPLP